MADEIQSLPDTGITQLETIEDGNYVCIDVL